ncbi:MAG: NADH-quinone oxidoreductase subunit H [Candidatus Omnitrophica bacterium]|nr:NADH-quinone oxidoreductase subunit H [Candidatus Omnitrophota bacterium]
MMPINNLILVTGQVILLVLFAPLVSGFIRKIKNNLRMRKGPSVLQPYYNVQKLISKDEVISRHASWIFLAAPVIVFASIICALFLVLLAQLGPFGNNDMAILIAAFFVLGLGRFFLALAGLDTASSFGGMGSSREMFISSFAEPIAFVAVFVLCMSGADTFRISTLLAGFAILMVTLAETSRVPVDNQETHLELTMVHEAMVLEYSGRSLALIELASHTKQIIFFILLSWYFFPSMTGGVWGWVIFPGKIAIISLAIALIELSVAKMRLFRVVDFLSFSFFIALLASIAAGLGI